MKIIKTALVCMGLAVLPFTADAIVAKRDVRTVTQPDGSTLRIKVVGDEYMHFTTDEDGNLLCLDANGFYTYGEIAADGAVIPGNQRVGQSSAKPSVIKLKDLDFKDIALKRNIAERRMQTFMPFGQNVANKVKAKAPQTGIGLNSSTFPLTGSPKALIILVEFSDKSFTLSNPANYFNDMINGENFTQYQGTGSALKYFKDQSGGKFAPSFDVYGPVKLSKSYTYYGQNDRNGNDMHPDEMVTDAIKQLDSQVNFAQYDTDGDGLIDNVYVFYAGQGEAGYGGENTIWPHSWDVRAAGNYTRVDGVYVGHYACSNEWENGKPDGIGTFVHEFSHVMGLPDLYTTDYGSAYYLTPSEYSVLDYGPYNNNSRTPPNYGAYEKNALGWYEPMIIDGPMNVSLESIDTGQFGLIATSKNTEFFLFENRQLEGWDRYIPNHGMLIWHIDYNSTVFNSNTVNNNASHQYVDIEEANGKANSSNKTTMRGYTFPGTSKNTSFTASTTPAMKTWGGVGIDLPITEITEADGIITFKVAGGAVGLSTPEPEADVLATTQERSFTASWDAVKGATDYILTVYAGEGNLFEEISNAFDSDATTGWTASQMGYYTTDGNYGAASPSFKFSSNNQTLTSPELPGEATKIEFWSKGQSSKDTYLTIEGDVDGQWVKIADYTPKSNQAETAVIEDLPEGVKQIRFTMHKSTGNIAIDDIVISCTGSVTILSDYNGISTNGQTTYVVDKLKDDETKYYFTVQATDGKNFSEVSAPVYVDVPRSTGISSIFESNDATVEYYNLQGMPVSNPMPGTIVIRRQGNTTSKILIK